MSVGSRRQWRQVTVELQTQGKAKADIARALRERFRLGALAALRHAHGWSQDDAAREWCHRWPDLPKTNQDISSWETGRHTPPVDIFERLAELYSCDLADVFADRQGYRRFDEAASVEQMPSSLGADDPETDDSGSDGDVERLRPWVPSRTIEQVNLLTSLDLTLNRRQAAQLVVGVVVGAALLEPVERWLAAGGRSSHPPIAHGPRSISSQEVTAIERSARLFRGWDDHFGGGLRRKAVVGQLAEVGDLLKEQYDGESSLRLFSVMADLSETAATMSWDSGLHGAAQRYYLLALQSAKLAGDHAFGANVLAAMARQLLYIDRPDDALELIRLAQEGSAGRASASVRAMLHTREGWAYAKQGRINAFHRATGKAEDALADARPNEDPYWIGYFDAAELAGVTSGRLLELSYGRPKLASETASYISRAVALRRPESMRSLALDKVGLAEARFLEGELDEGARLGHEAVDVAEQTKSDRVRVQLVSLYRQTRSLRRTPVVAELRDRVRPLLQPA